MKNVIVFLAVSVLSLSLVQRAYGFSGLGSGTEEDPYIITNVSQLQEMQGGLNAWYVLGNDVNAFDTVNWNSGQGFLPVGDSAHAFAGHFDGKGLTIEGLFINMAGSDNIGLFGVLRIATVKDVTLLDPNISGRASTGSLVGYSDNSTITDCSCIVATVKGAGDNVGGLVGNKSAGTIVGCSAYQPIVTSTANTCGGLLGYQSSGSLINCRCYEARVIGGTSNTGGLVGYNYTSSINDSFAEDVIVTGSDSCGGLVGSWRYGVGNLTNSHSSGIVMGTSNVGGLVGYCNGYYGVIFSNCSSQASVTGSGDYCGGLVGNICYSTITDCYATGRVVGNNYIGGLVGISSSSNNVITCHASGNVWGLERVGGLIGNNNSPATKCYSSGSIVNGGKYVGGCVGYHESSTISRCFSTSDANANGIDCGGFVGISNAAITDCFATGRASGYNFIGGFAGEAAGSATTTNCYSSSVVLGAYNFGGFAGYNSGTCNACFWDVNTSGVGISGCGMGKTTAEMMQRATFDPPWNFSTSWGIDEGKTYPYLMELYPICGDPWHPYPIGDLNYDCHVDFYDFAIFTSNWLECTDPNCG